MMITFLLLNLFILLFFFLKRAPILTGGGGYCFSFHRCGRNHVPGPYSVFCVMICTCPWAFPQVGSACESPKIDNRYLQLSGSPCLKWFSSSYSHPTNTERHVNLTLDLTRFFFWSQSSENADILSTEASEQDWRIPSSPTVEAKH